MFINPFNRKRKAENQLEQASKKIAQSDADEINLHTSQSRVEKKKPNSDILSSTVLEGHEACPFLDISESEWLAKSLISFKIEDNDDNDNDDKKVKMKDFVIVEFMNDLIVNTIPAYDETSTISAGQENYKKFRKVSFLLHFLLLFLFLKTLVYPRTQKNPIFFK